MATSLGSFSNFIYKSYGKQGAAVLIPQEFGGKIKSVTYVTAQGERQTQYMGGAVNETGAIKFNLGAAPESLGPGTVRVTLDTGEVFEQPIENPLMDFREGKATTPQSPNSGPGATGDFGGFAPGALGFGAVPAYLGDQYPSKISKTKFTPIKAAKGVDYSPVSYDPAEAADYEFTDPMKVAREFGGFNREEIRKNYSLAKDLALDQLDTELEGLQMFAPAAAALKRSETSLDNIFNQQQRTQQVNAVLPNARGDLEAQRSRANTYARGEVPDSVTDRALELGVRSQAADIGYSGGFGASSSVSRKISDLMSAENRIKLSGYGDQLLTNNINTSSALLLAPTEYSDAGGQIKVMPQINAGVQAGQNLNTINAETLINPTNALSTTIQQRQFGTNLQQQTNQFNATNQIATNQFNASNTLNAAQFNANVVNNNRQFNAQGKFQQSQINSAARNDLRMGRFAYDVSYAGAVAGASQLNMNTQLALQQQAQSAQIFQDQLAAAQNSAQTGAIAGGVAAAIPQLTALLDSIKSIFNSTQTDPAKVNTAPVDVDPGYTVSPSVFNDTTSGVDHGGPEGSLYIPPGSEMPEGFMGIPTADGGVVAVPDPAGVSLYDSFLYDLDLA